MKNNLKIWVQAARLRTLPLSVSGIIMGNALALSHNDFSFIIFLLSILTAIAFQIVSNFANDYGDGIKGTDNEQRIGPKRVLQQGLLTSKNLKRGILVSVLVSIILSIALIYESLGLDKLLFSVLFILLAIGAVAAAIKYTVGTNPYGYSGLGDLFVFIFFGWVSVIGSYFLQINSIDLSIVLFATSVGLLSVAVLNLNNMRDIENDLNSSKITLAVRLGGYKAKVYHFFLISIAIILFFIGIGEQPLLIKTIYTLVFVPLFLHLYRVFNVKEPKQFDPELKKLALTIFFISIVFFVTSYLNQ
ncbi:1,4-dihydroxy-2-naphthoate octaprenyltransferase [Flavobacteriaceae bacterium]|nr:1,4-dihydroxy-2-naphthoate octaprenyltransferase [Flavobacteriaceae bacterium]MDA9250293.1 1,4-dihydroxy-2-naphthoate octaprenyltransferase [Flavobacteriaceae bacterium]